MVEGTIKERLRKLRDEGLFAFDNEKHENSTNCKICLGPLKEYQKKTCSKKCSIIYARLITPLNQRRSTLLYKYRSLKKDYDILKSKYDKLCKKK